MPDRAIAWRRPSGGLEEQRLTVPYSWYGWLTVQARRWQYTPPWGCSRWALLRVQFFRGGDEYCNNTPLLGHVIFWKPWGRLRTSPCEQCVAEGRLSADD